MALLRRSILVLLAAGAAGGCVRDPDILVWQQAIPAVHSVLEAGSTEATVLVTRFPPGADRAARVSGAEVYLGTGADSVRLVERVDGPACGDPPWMPGTPLGCYVGTLPEPVQPESRWWLRVRYPTGEVATGSTTVPAPLSLVEPESGTRVPIRTRYLANHTFDSPGPEPAGRLAVSWMERPAGLHVEAMFHEGRGYSGGVALTEPCHVGHGRLSPPAGELPERSGLDLYGVSCGQVTQWDSVAVELNVMVYDSLLTRYVADLPGMAGGVRADQGSVGLQGALGVFGAFAPARRRVTIVPDDEPMTVGG